MTPRGPQGRPEGPQDSEVSRVARSESGAQHVTLRGPLTAEAGETLQFSAQTPRPELPLPRMRFEDEGEIARGGMSSVRRVFDRLILREVAMKVLEPTGDFDELAHFVEEAQITGQLDHPNIVPVHDIELDEQGLPTRFTMKLVRGQTLEAWAREMTGAARTSDQLEGLLSAFLRVCDAVSFAHSRGVIHRDLKPSNVMVGSHGQVYVMDWGVALLREATRASAHAPLPRVRGSGESQPETAGSLTGTPSYMAPEQAWGWVSEIDERTDVYGLGGILYYLLTLRPPHDGQDAEQSLELARSGRVPLPGEINTATTLPPQLCRIAMRALSPARSERQATVAELKREVEAFMRGGGWFAHKRFTAGQVIVEQGASGDAAYIILEGECDCWKQIGSERTFVCTLVAGEVFGETAIFTSGTRLATVVAKTDVTVIVVTREALDRELDRSQWLRSFVRAVAQRFVELDRQLSQRISEQPPGTKGPV